MQLCSIFELRFASSLQSLRLFKHFFKGLFCLCNLPLPRPAPYIHFVHVPCAVSCGHFSKIAANIWCLPVCLDLVSPQILFYAYPRSPLQMMFQFLTFFSHFSSTAACFITSMWKAAKMMVHSCQIIVCISSQCCIKGHHIASMKSAGTVFTQWRQVNTTNGLLKAPSLNFLSLLTAFASLGFFSMTKDGYNIFKNTSFYILVLMLA